MWPKRVAKVNQESLNPFAIAQAQLDEAAALPGLEEVHRVLDHRMTEAFTAVVELAGRRKIDLRRAAYMISVDRVARACKLRGWV